MKWKRIRIMESDGTVIFCDTVDRIPVKEEVIKKISMEHYHEPDPCIIYRTCITRTIYIELMERLMIGEKGEKVPCALLGDIPEKLELKLENGSMQLL